MLVACIDAPVLAKAIYNTEENMSGRPEKYRQVNGIVLRALLLAVALFAVVFGCSTADAQVLYGTLTGNVSDQSGAAVVNATVRATETSMNYTKSVSTNAEGSYVFTNLIPGTYNMTIVSTQNFAKFEENGVVLKVNHEQRVDAVLKAASTQQSVTVTTAAPELQTDRADVNSEIATEQLTDPARNICNIYRYFPSN
jgi:hypothetical protein